MSSVIDTACKLKKYFQCFITFRTQVFLEPIGRTNTEYANFYPIYGSRLHEGSVKRGCHQPSPANPSIQLLKVDRNFSFYTVETSQKEAVATLAKNRNFASQLQPFIGKSKASIQEDIEAQIQARKQVHADGGCGSYSESNAEGAVSTHSSSPSPAQSSSSAPPPELISVLRELHEPMHITTVAGSITWFTKYVPSCNNKSVRFDFHLEDATGLSKRSVNATSTTPHLI